MSDTRKNKNETNWEIKENMFFPRDLKKNRNCRKFFCFDLENNYLENYIIVHNEKVEDKLTNNLKIRLFANGKENLFNLNLRPNKPIETIKVKEIFQNVSSKNTLIQIESGDYNFHATGLILNTLTGVVSTDHFTGG